MQLMIREDVEQKVLGSLLTKPYQLMSSDVKLGPEDFTARIHKIILGAIVYLANNGIVNIMPVDIDGALQPYQEQYEYYRVNNGPVLVDKIRDVVDTDNFKYYYRTLKKITLINSLITQGFDVSEFFNPEENDAMKKAKTVSRFENATVEDIISYYDKMLLVARNSFTSGKDKVSQQAGQGLAELVEGYQQAPDIGLPTNSKKLNTIFRGRRFGKFYLFSSIQGGGKSRIAMGDAGRIALTKVYNPVTKQWDKNPNPQAVLYIATEMEIYELQTMILAYVTGINETTILNGTFTIEQMPIVREGVKVIEESPLYFEYMSSFNITDIEEEIKIYKQQYNIQALFFDYISLNMKSSSEIAGKMGIKEMREDQILLIFSERLKILANEYNIHISSATQLSSEWETKETPNQNLLRGSKALADKCDCACIVLPPNKQEESIIENLQEKYEYKANMVFHIYKIRSGNFQRNMKVFVYFDYGTCRLHDCFVTDKKNNLISVDDTIIV